MTIPIYIILGINDKITFNNNQARLLNIENNNQDIFNLNNTIMKKTTIYTLLLACAIAIAVPVSVSAQSVVEDQQKKIEKAEKKEKKEKERHARAVEAPVPPSAPVPPGREGKAESSDNVKGYEKTSEIGNKEGWNKDGGAVTEKDIKKAEKEIKRDKKDIKRASETVKNNEKAVKEAKKGIKEEKRIAKAERKATKARLKEMKKQQREAKRLRKAEINKQDELKDIREDKIILEKEIQQTKTIEYAPNK